LPDLGVAFGPCFPLIRLQALSPGPVSAAITNAKHVKQLCKSTSPPLTAKFGIGWFGNHTRSSSTTLQRSRRSREFSFGYFSFAEKEK
jgi:hypothetical protein